MKEFNINNNIKVRLTDKGYKVLEDYHNKILESLPPLAKDSYGPFKYPETDEEGYISFQLCQFMRIFGNASKQGGVIPYETEVLFDEKDLNNHPENDNSFESVFPYKIGTYLTTTDQNVRHIDQVYEYIVDRTGVSAVLILDALKDCRRLSERINIDDLLSRWTVYEKSNNKEYTKNK